MSPPDLASWLLVHVYWLKDPRLRREATRNLALPLRQGDFIYLLQAARSFDGDKLWGQKLDQLAGGEFSGICPHCGVDLYLVIGKYGYFVAAGDWVRPGKIPGTVQVRPDVKRAPIEPARETLPPTGQWMYDRCITANQAELAECIKYLFGTSTCTECGEDFALQEALAKA
jgi:hypothetical protein